MTSMSFIVNRDKMCQKDIMVAIVSVNLCILYFCVAILTLCETGYLLGKKDRKVAIGGSLIKLYIL